MGANFNDINNCFTTNGDDVLAELGDQTHSVEPTITFVPTVVFNDVYNQDLQDQSLTDFKAALCSVVDRPIPAACGTLNKTKKKHLLLSHVPIFRK